LAAGEGREGRNGVGNGDVMKVIFIINLKVEMVVCHFQINLGLLLERYFERKKKNQ